MAQYARLQPSWQLFSFHPDMHQWTEPEQSADAKGSLQLRLRTEKSNSHLHHFVRHRLQLDFQSIVSLLGSDLAQKSNLGTKLGCSRWLDLCMTSVHEHIGESELHRWLCSKTTGPNHFNYRQNKM